MSLRLTLLLCIVFVAACQPSNGKQSSHDREKNAKVQQAWGRVLYATERLAVNGRKSYEETKLRAKEALEEMVAPIVTAQASSESAVQSAASMMAQMRELARFDSEGWQQRIEAGERTVRQGFGSLQDNIQQSRTGKAMGE